VSNSIDDVQLFLLDVSGRSSLVSSSPLSLDLASERPYSGDTASTLVLFIEGGAFVALILYIRSRIQFIRLAHGCLGRCYIYGGSLCIKRHVRRAFNSSPSPHNTHGTSTSSIPFILPTTICTQTIITPSVREGTTQLYMVQAALIPLPHYSHLQL
jgi:hypothetical protein